MILCANPLAQNLSYKEEIQEAISKVVASNRYILGSELESLEIEFANYIGVKFSIGVANGTDAIEISLRALDIGSGDEVITVSHTAVATVAAIELTGAIPVLVDVSKEFYTIDINQIESAITEKTKAIIAVHLYGQSCDIDLLQSICKQRNIYLIEDVSQAHGSQWKGKKLGSYGIFGCFSCYPTKNLGAIGDAGLITTNDSDLADKVKMIREYGWKKRYISEIKGRNSRLDEIQSAILRIKLRNLENDNLKRNNLANIYSQKLANSEIVVPKIRENSTHVFHLYVIQIKQRNKLQSYLYDNGIQCGIHYPTPIHLQPAYFGKIKLSGSLSITEEISNNVLSLPIYPELSFEEQNLVIENILNFKF